MADPKMAPKPDMDDETDPAAGAAPAGDMGADAADGDQGQVLCTVLKNPDGGYTLVAGDEDDGGEGGEAPEAGADMGGDMGAAKPEGQTFSEPGALLKGILDLLNKDQEAGAGPAQGHFEAGFTGDSAPTPKKAMPPKM